MRKYFNKKVTYNNIIFDSQNELQTYIELLELEKQGKISNLRLQPEYVLIPSFRNNQNKAMRPCKYIADFEYIEDNKIIVIDVKSVFTQTLSDYRIKTKLLQYLYKDIIFKEVVYGKKKKQK